MFRTPLLPNWGNMFHVHHTGSCLPRIHQFSILQANLALELPILDTDSLINAICK